MGINLAIREFDSQVAELFLVEESADKVGNQSPSHFTPPQAACFAYFELFWSHVGFGASIDGECPAATGAAVSDIVE